VFKSIDIPAINRSGGVDYRVEYSLTPEPSTNADRANMDKYTWTLLSGGLDPTVPHKLNAPTVSGHISAVRLVFEALDEDLGIPFGFGDGNTVILTFTVSGFTAGMKLNNIGVLLYELLDGFVIDQETPYGEIEVEDEEPYGPITPEQSRTPRPTNTSGSDGGSSESIVRTGQQVPMAVFVIGGVLLLAGLALLLMRRRQAGR